MYRGEFYIKMRGIYLRNEKILGFLNSTNGNDPNMDPCGTPHDTSI